MAKSIGMIDPAIFEDLQARADQDTSLREELRDVLKTLEKQARSVQAILSRIHSTPVTQLSELLNSTEAAIKEEVDTISKLSQAASGHPYYKWNSLWSRHIQDTAFHILFCGWFGGYAGQAGGAQVGRLLTIEQVGQIMQVPVNLKDRDAFHLTIEEYLHALISLVDELARLARNSVTMGDYRRPLQISQFIKDLHAGFQILNLKNDALRRRGDGIKYRVKEVEDVVYDLSLRNLVPRDEAK